MNQIRSLAALAAVSALAACNTYSPPDPTALANPEMLRVLTAYQGLGAQPVQTLTVQQARSQPTMGDAAGSVATQMGIPTRAPVAQISDITIQGAVGPLSARVYNPKVAVGAAPVILYFHGGGWVTGNLDTYDASDRELANGTGAIVVSVQYRLGPENRFPAAQDDANASYAWLLQNAATMGGDPQKIAVAGESAGGNMAINTAIWARDNRLQPPVHELLIYPVVGTDLNTTSYGETLRAVPLNRLAIQWYIANYTNDPGELEDARFNVVGAADLRGLPPTTIISAQIDPLRSENEALAKKMQSLGVNVEQRTYSGVTHEFFGMGNVVPQAKQAEDFAFARLSTSFTQPAAPAPSPRYRGYRRPQS
jgi:acetyl esterase